MPPAPVNRPNPTNFLAQKCLTKARKKIWSTSSPGGTPTRQPHALPTTMPPYSSSNVVKIVGKDLRRSHSDIAMAIEKDALAAIKTLVVKAENAMVSAMTLLTMAQDREECVRNCAARLRGQAQVWKLSKNCSHNPFEAVNYTDDMVRDALIRGLSLERQ